VAVSEEPLPAPPVSVEPEGVPAKDGLENCEGSLVEELAERL
jgi:hypothetical protein